MVVDAVGTTVRHGVLSSRVIAGAAKGWMDTWMGFVCSQGGPSHHREWLMRSLGRSPLEAQSARFVAVGTCFQMLAGSKLRMAAALFPTKVLKRLGLPLSQFKTIVLSLHANTEDKSSDNVILTLVRSLESKCAPQSSSRGIDCCFSGDTLVFAAIRESDGGPDSYVVCKYTTAAYASLLALQNP